MPDFNALMDRVAALEKEAMAALSTPVTADATDFFYHTQGSYPFFVNRLGALAVPEDEDSEDFDVYDVDVVMRLVIGHMTQGYADEPENSLQTYVPQVVKYFNERELLQSATYTDALDGLIRARVTACRGLVVFQQTGTGDMQVGTEFTLSCRFEEEIEQQYL